MGRLGLPASNFADCMNIGEAAEFLGVSTATLRNWDRTGKLKPRRHPHNGYRIYLHEDLELVLRSAELSSPVKESFAPHVDWSQMRDTEHFVQFYENDDYLIDSASAFIGAALNQRESGIVAATPEHCIAIERKLAACGIDVAEAQASGHLLVFDAAETLSRFMVGRSPDERKFDETIGAVIRQLEASGRRIRAFGEMVALLWADGNRGGAIELEQLWNALARRHRFSLFCAYPIASFNSTEQTNDFQGLCACHSRVIPAESYAAAETVDQRLRAISLLQHKAHSLEAEIEHRKQVETLLAKRELAGTE